uniref:Uncharacterized protein n=1 Tax=Ditylum brightwellii TaxID=49249 RepID=A0A6U3VF83_9STRA|mmetsp:Transcript_7907/g.11786  ORF Transcript_7907/g.11786 Transcript_7907/m.11786 type:complete len:262 (+) Transcript_7907:162-947(+)
MKFVSGVSVASFLLASFGVAAEVTSERKLTMTKPPRQEMYRELIYIEQRCRDYIYQPVNLGVPNVTASIGDKQNFKCDLYEAAINFGQYGGDKVGETFWSCEAFAFQDFNDVEELLETGQTFDNIQLWDCTVTDFIGDGVNVDDDDTYIRNEGGAQEDAGVLVSLGPPFDCFFNISDTDGSWQGVTCQEDVVRTDANFEAFHSHTGIFTTVGGAGVAKGARGQMEVQWDFYQLTWYHVYTIEVWALEQPPIPLFGSGHKFY